MEITFETIGQRPPLSASLSQKPLSVKLASTAFSLDNFRCIVLIFTRRLGADGGEEAPRNTTLCYET